MTEKDIALFNDSLERCQRRPGFLDRFYDLFIASSEEVARKFEHTDFVRQKRMITMSLYHFMSVADGLPEGDLHLNRIAERHGRNAIGVEPRLYDCWLNCLIQAVKEYDPVFDDDTERAWRKILGHGIAVMKARY